MNKTFTTHVFYYSKNTLCLYTCVCDDIQGFVARFLKTGVFFVQDFKSLALFYFKEKKKMEEKSNIKIEEIVAAPQKVSVLRKIFFNVLGFFAGYFVGGIAFELARWLLVGVLGNIKLLRVILSWPVEYGVYATTGVIFIDALVSLNICGLVSKIGKAKRNYSCYILATVRMLSYIISLIATIKSGGFNFDIIWTVIISLGAFILTASATANNE